MKTRDHSSLPKSENILQDQNNTLEDCETMLLALKDVARLEVSVRRLCDAFTDVSGPIIHLNGMGGEQWMYLGVALLQFCSIKIASMSHSQEKSTSKSGTSRWLLPSLYFHRDISSMQISLIICESEQFHTSLHFFSSFICQFFYYF